ncbi:hypothetical protein MRX96_055626 [Rhipicephalus microplus]
MSQRWMFIVRRVKELFVRATVNIPLRDRFWWLRLPSPMCQRWMHIMRRVEELFVRATVKIPLREWFRLLRLPSPMFQRWMLIVPLDAHVLRVVELFYWLMLLRLLIALSAITEFVFGVLLIVAVVVGGPTLLCALADFMTDAFSEVLILCNQFIQNPGQERLFHKARGGLNM